MNDQPGWFVWLQIIVMLVLAWTGWIVPVMVVIMYLFPVFALLLAVAEINDPFLHQKRFRPRNGEEIL
jgi:hypothetical protein